MASSFGQSKTSSPGSSGQRKPKRSIRDRTTDETISLVTDLVRAAAEAGPRAGPVRTLQAYLAVTRTVQDFLPAPGGATAEPFSAPVALRKLFERMGATYVKLGQFVASSPTLFPKEYVLEFQKCLDATESLEWSVIKNVIEGEIGESACCFVMFSGIPRVPPSQCATCPRDWCINSGSYRAETLASMCGNHIAILSAPIHSGPISRTFASVDEKPLASASIAQVSPSLISRALSWQCSNHLTFLSNDSFLTMLPITFCRASVIIPQVHAAKLLTGEDVVIKVQKPGIDESLKADLSFIYVASRVLEFIQPDWERTSLSAIAGDIRSSMLEELDFESEATNVEEFREFLTVNGLNSQATAPRIYSEFCFGRKRSCWIMTFPLIFLVQNKVLVWT